MISKFLWQQSEYIFQENFDTFFALKTVFGQNNDFCLQDSGL